MEAKKFKNFTDRDFTWKFDGVEYTFKAGQEIFMEAFKADHFAKHLIDRELNVKNIVTNNVSERAKLETLCFPTDEVITPMEAFDINEKARKPKKKAEPEFEDLDIKPRKK